MILFDGYNQRNWDPLKIITPISSTAIGVISSKSTLESGKEFENAGMPIFTPRGVLRSIENGSKFQSCCDCNSVWRRNTKQIITERPIRRPISPGTTCHVERSTDQLRCGVKTSPCVLGNPLCRGEKDVKTVVRLFSHRGVCSGALIVNRSDLNIPSPYLHIPHINGR